MARSRRIRREAKRSSAGPTRDGGPAGGSARDRGVCGRAEAECPAQRPGPADHGPALDRERELSMEREHVEAAWELEDQRSGAGRDAAANIGASWDSADGRGCMTSPAVAAMLSLP